MILKKGAEKLWQQGLANNGNGSLHDYGGAIYWFAERWAERMEAAFQRGRPLEDCAEEMEGILLEKMGKWSLTGFQYGAAISVLSQVWVFGSWLRMWHNIRMQIRDEGDKANREGGVLNPALLMIRE